MYNTLRLMKSHLSKIFNNKFFPLVLLGIVMITYGYQLSRMGLYWDDWEIIYLDNFHSPGAYWDYFLYARPLTSWLYLVLSPVIGMNPVAWQVVNIIFRWAGMTFFWFALRLVWPKRSFEIGWISLLLAAYPAFTQHSVAVTYARHFACLALFAVSLWLNLLALENPKRWLLYTIPAALASLLQLITLEYFFGLEFLRPLFLWILIRRKEHSLKNGIKNLLVQWAPYALIILIFVGYRFVWYPLVSPNPEANAPVLFERLAENPVGEMIKFANLIVQDFVHLNLDNWLEPMEPGDFELKAKANWLSWGFAALIALFSAWFLIKASSDSAENDGNGDTFIRDSILFGLVGFLAGGIPVWITGRQSIGGPWADRFALGPMFGAILLLVGLIHWFSRRRLQQSILVGVIFGFALSSQMQTVNKYRLSWDNQKDFYWQLNWRAPSIKPGTAVIGPAMPFALVNDLHIGFALNSIYDQGAQSFEAPLWFFRAGGLQGELVPALKPGYPIDYRYLTAHFSGTTDQVLVAEYSYGTSCLHIIAEDDRNRIGLANDTRMLFKLSKPELIDTSPDSIVHPPEEIFGPEPDHGWCYYYQKMDQARQTGDWEEAARLADEAGDKGFSPKSVFEYSPVILSYIHTGQIEKAGAASLAARQKDEDQTGFICSLWKNHWENQDDPVFQDIFTSLECNAVISTAVDQ